PTGLEYIASALKPHVEKLTFVDLRLPGPLRKPERLKQFIQDEIDLLCVSINWEYHFQEVCDLVNSLPHDVMTIVGGKQATDCLDEVFDACPNVDIAVRGEGEQTIAELAQGVNLADIKGISYRNGEEITHNPNRPLAAVEGFGFPDRTLRGQRYHFNVGGFALRGEEFDIILTARGCPYNCKFCTFTLSPWGQKRNYSARTVDSVIEELKQISAGIILIADENFFVQPRRAKEICERIVAEGIQKRFLVLARIEIFEHPDVLEAAARAGIKIFLLGIESPQDRILEQLNKGFDTAKLRRAFETFRQYPFYYHGYFIYGNVTETEEEMMQIPVFARELGLDSITYQKLRVEKYSPLKELVEATPGYYVGDDRIVYSELLRRPGLKRISRQITRDFYTVPQVLRLIRKLFRIQLFEPRNLPALLLGLEQLVAELELIARWAPSRFRRFRGTAHAER
ncbi:MAG: radical SAM protein, partial [Deltaproteobacteria bacterium]